MSGQALTRRQFTLTAAAALATTRLHAQSTGAHADVAAIEHDYILASAKQALAEGGETVLRPDDANFFTDPANPAKLRKLATKIAALTAGYLLDHTERYAMRAESLLDNWLDPVTESGPHRMNIAPFRSEATLPSRDRIVDLIGLAEIARASSFLADFGTSGEAAIAPLNQWLADALTWLNTDPQARLARDTKDHRASAWLFITAALARATRNEAQLDQLRLRFRKPTLRNQIVADGRFPQEIATDNPFRNSLFNFDLLAGACQLLSSPFDDLWNYELPDGPGIRSVAAFLYPLIREPRHWPFVADAQNFHDLPGRRPGLLFAGRAYDRAEYVDCYKSLPATPPPDAIAYSFPITQPLLFTARAPHGL